MERKRLGFLCLDVKINFFFKYAAVKTNSYRRLHNILNNYMKKH